MADLKETAIWESVRQLETSDPVMGGENGVSNTAPRQLANRTFWLKTELDKAIENIAGLGSSKTNNTITITGVNGLTGGGNLTANRTMSIDKASLNDLNNGIYNKVITADVLKPKLDEKAPLLHPALTGTATIGNTSYPAMNLIPTVGQWGLRLEASNNQAYFAVRLLSDMSNSTGQKCVFNLPISSKDGMHTIAMTSDLTGFATKGTTLADYGITNSYTSAQVDTSLSNKADKTVTVSAGTGLTGGGTLDANRTLNVDKASSADINSGTSNKVITADTIKPALDAKASRNAAEIVGSVTIQENIYPSLRLASTNGANGVLFQSSGTIHGFYVRPKASINSSAGQIAEYLLPDKIGSHTIAMTSDLAGKGLLGTVDLNTVLKKGIYGQEQNAQATSARNYPYQESGYLTVADGPYRTVQEYVTISGKRAIRYASKNDGSTWNGWVILSTLNSYGITDAYTKAQVDTALADKANLSLFANSFVGSTGYQRLPSANGSPGMIVQAGTVTVGDNQITTVTLPIAFPNQFLAVVGMGEYDSAITANVVMGAHGKIMSLSQFKIGVSASFDSATTNTSWIAIGR